jgi:hypothetical protein
MSKPLGRKSYGSIGHLPSSRLGPGDHNVHEGQARICCEKVRDKHDEVIVQEKLDGSCCAVAKVGGQILALGRAGWLAQTSPYEQHQLFAAWVRGEYVRFDAMLDEGERVVGEWLAQAHGTRYALVHEPFVPFDIMRDGLRMPFDAVAGIVGRAGFRTPHLLHRGSAIAVAEALARLDTTHHGALDPIEGVMYRVQRKGAVDFLAKFVRHDKVDGCYLPERTNQGAVWNWRPESSE